MLAPCGAVRVVIDLNGFAVLIREDSLEGRILNGKIVRMNADTLIRIHFARAAHPDERDVVPGESRGIDNILNTFFDALDQLIGILDAGWSSMSTVIPIKYAFMRSIASRFWVSAAAALW